MQNIQLECRHVVASVNIIIVTDVICSKLYTILIQPKMNYLFAWYEQQHINDWQKRYGLHSVKPKKVYH